MSKSSNIRTDSLVFRLHCNLTSILLAIALIYVLAIQIFTDPIACDAQRFPSLDQQLLNIHCLSKPTYRWIEASNHFDVFEPRPTKLSYPYYQWIWVILLAQMCAFYFPKFLWNVLENQQVEKLVKQYRKTSKLDPKLGKENLAKALNQNFDSPNTKIYFLSYIFCEFGVIFNILVQSLVLHRIFHAKWLTFGLDFLKENFFSYSGDSQDLDDFSMQESSYVNDSMSIVFPILTKCDYRQLSPAGSLQIFSPSCALPLNGFVSKFYLILWFWMLALIVLFCVKFLSRFFKFGLRIRALKAHESKFKLELSALYRKMTFTDWFWLDLIEQNLSSLDVLEAMEALVMLRIRANEQKKENKLLSDVM